MSGFVMNVDLFSNAFITYTTAVILPDGTAALIIHPTSMPTLEAGEVWTFNLSDGFERELSAYVADATKVVNPQTTATLVSACERIGYTLIPAQ